MKDKNNNPLNLDFDVELISESSNSFQVSSNVLSNTFTIDGSQDANSILSINFANVQLTRGSQISVSFTLSHRAFTNTTPPNNVPVEQSVSTPVAFTYTLQEDFATVNDLATNQDFIDRVGTALPEEQYFLYMTQSILHLVQVQPLQMDITAVSQIY